MKELAIAFGLLLVLEGLLYAIFPKSMKNMLLLIKEISEQKLRTSGLIFAVLGFIIIWYTKT